MAKRRILIVPAREEAPTTVKRKKAKRWTMADRAAIPAPTREKLTKSQWQQWGDNLKALRQNGFVNASGLSLADSNDAVRSIHRCSQMRAYAQVMA